MAHAPMLNKCKVTSNNLNGKIFAVSFSVNFVTYSKKSSQGNILGIFGNIYGGIT